MIDMHTHWRPAEFTDALRARTTEPRVVRNQAGVEVLKTRMGEEPLSKAFDEVDFHLARMNRQGVSTSVLSLLGSFCWIEAQPLCTAPIASSAAPTVLNLAASGPARRSRKRKSARKRATRSCMATPPRCSHRSPRSRRPNKRRTTGTGKQGGQDIRKKG